MKRSPMPRSAKPLERRTPIARRKAPRRAAAEVSKLTELDQRPRRRRATRRSGYARRDRDTPRMRWVRCQPCCAPRLPHDVGPCDGPTEADHAGERGLSHKAADDTCIPLCVRHHREPGLGAILYGRLRRGELRVWKDEMIAETRRRYLHETAGAAGM